MHLWTLTLPCCSPENLCSHHVPEQATPYKGGVSCTTHPLLLGHGAFVTAKLWGQQPLLVQAEVLLWLPHHCWGKQVLTQHLDATPTLLS